MRQSDNVVRVTYQGREKPCLVGRLAMQKRRVVFEYDPEFIETGVSLSPFQLPLKAGVRSADVKEFFIFNGC